MASNDEAWRRKMLVENVPEDWSQDMLENFVEVVTKGELEEDGVERFCGVRHTVLLTFRQPLSEEHLQNAQARTQQRSKPLRYSLIPLPPTALLATEVTQGLTTDNLFFYFESPRSGGVEGTVTSCDVYPGPSMAVVTFNDPKVAEAVLAVNPHSPCRGTSITMEPCYLQFHRKILEDLSKPAEEPSGGSGGAGPHRQWPSGASAGPPRVAPKPYIPPSRRWQASNDDRPRVPPKPAGVARYIPPDQRGRASRADQPPAPPQPPPCAETPDLSPSPARTNVPASQSYGHGQGPGHCRPWRGRGNPRHPPQHEQPGSGAQGSAWRSEAPHNQRGGPRRRRNRRRSHKSQSGSSEDLSQPERSGENPGWGQKWRGGRHPGHYYRSRGRGYKGNRGGFVSQAQEAEMFECEPGHATSPAQAAAPRPIVLDEDCNPVPRGWTPRSENAVSPDWEECYETEDKHDDSDSFFASLEDICLEAEDPEVFQEAPRPAGTNPHPAQPPAAAHRAGPEHHPAKPQSKDGPNPNPATQPERWAETSGSAPHGHSDPQSHKVLEQAAEQLQQKLEYEREVQKREQQMKEKVEKLERELERERREKQELQNRKKDRLQLPAYQLRLMRDFAQSCTACDISIHEREGSVDFSGTEENVDVAKIAFLTTLQDREEIRLDVTPTVTAILRTEAGQLYLSQLSEGYHNCSFDVQESCVVCTSFSRADVHASLKDVQRNIHVEKIKISKSILPQLQMLKHQLEQEFKLVRITLPDESSSDVMVEGINGDFELVRRRLKDHCSQNQPGQVTFQITNRLETRACGLWCAKEVESITALILKNHGDVKRLDIADQMGFTLHCHKDVLSQVQPILSNIRKVTKSCRINLQEKLTRYSERALVINGINTKGVEKFCCQLEGILKNEGGWDTVIHFLVPAKCALPEFKYAPAKSARAARPARPKVIPSSRPPRQQVVAPPRHRRYRGGGGGSGPMRSFVTPVGNSSLTVKSGDISLESVDGIVCVVGEDMDLKQTAVGQALLKKHPHCAQLLPQGPQLTAAGAVIPMALQQVSPLQALRLQAIRYARPTQPSMLYFAVLTKWSPQQMMANIRTVTQKCLQLAAQQGNRSIAFPPLGLGRKFQFPLDTVVSAMFTTAHQFLQSNPGSLKDVVFVIYDVKSARQFREAAKKIMKPPMPDFLRGAQESTESASDDDDEEDDDVIKNPGDIFLPSVMLDDIPFGFFRAAQQDDDDDDDGGGGGDGGGGFWDARERVGDGSDNDDEEELNFFQLNDDDDQPDTNLPPAAVAASTQSAKAFEAQLCLRNQGDFRQVEQALLRELKSTFVYEERLTDIRMFKKLGASTMDEIKTEALKKSVVLNVQSAGAREVLLMRGQKEKVLEVKLLISNKERAHFLRKEAREKQQSGGLPSAAKRVQLPSYWKVCKDNLFKDFEQFVRDFRTYGKMYTMGNEEVREIDALMQKTWVQHLVGAGKDAMNLRHQRVTVVKVERLENPHLWEEYCTHREQLIRRTNRQPFPPIGKMKGSSGPVQTTQNLPRQSLLSREIFPQVNEHYLFHGTKKEYIQPIHDQGLDTRIANEKAMLGRGVYASESATKADQYTDDKANRTSGNKTMILMRVLLGEAFINKQTNPTKYSRPPCKKCYQDRCKCHGSGHFDSVIDDAGRNFREFVIYDRCMCYPEYFITYQRI